MSNRLHFDETRGSPTSNVGLLKIVLPYKCVSNYFMNSVCCEGLAGLAVRAKACNLATLDFRSYCY